MDFGDTDTLMSASPSLRSPKPLGFWATILWFVLGASISVAAIIATAAAIIFMHFLRQKGAELAEFDAFFERNAFMFGFAGYMAMALTMLLFLRWRIGKRGWRFYDYIALNSPRPRDIAIAAAAILAFIGIQWLIDNAFDIGSQDRTTMLADYKRAAEAGALPLLWLLMTVVAPFCEEAVFRGYLYRGWAASSLGVPGTVILSSVLFASVHLQYSVFGVIYIFVLSLALGWLRHRSGNVTVTMFAHALNNAISAFALAYSG
jgi:uncharacterized protein